MYDMHGANNKAIVPISFQKEKTPMSTAHILRSRMQLPGERQESISVLQCLFMFYDLNRRERTLFAKLAAKRLAQQINMPKNMLVRRCRGYREVSGYMMGPKQL